MFTIKDYIIALARSKDVFTSADLRKLEKNHSYQHGTGSVEIRKLISGKNITKIRTAKNYTDVSEFKLGPVAYDRDIPEMYLEQKMLSRKW